MMHNVVPAYVVLIGYKAHELYSKKNAQEITLFCGSPGAGKSTFYWKQLQPLGFERVNQDILKTVSCHKCKLPCALTNTRKREKCLKVAGEYLDEGKSVAVGMYSLSSCTAYSNVGC